MAQRGEAGRLHKIAANSQEFGAIFLRVGQF
jgi:hypothetical protein